MDRGPGCYPCRREKVKCSLVASVGAPARAGGDGKGSLLAIHEDLCEWYFRWKAELEWRADLDSQYLSLAMSLSKDMVETRKEVCEIWAWINEQGWAEVTEDVGEGALVAVRWREEKREEQRDLGEGRSTGAEKWREERRQAVAEDSEEVIDLEEFEEDGDGSEEDEIEEEEVMEVQGKGKGKEKAMEENTLA
jgi:hypothetical protein